MKSIAHAWIGLMALERLKSLKRKKSRGYLGTNFRELPLGKKFDKYYQKQADKFVRFFDKRKDAFMQGAWFPDNVISDNLAGGHTYKLKKPSTESEIKKSKTISNRPPTHLSSIKAVEKRLNEKVYFTRGVLPDRCEALIHSIRDMILIQRHEDKGSDILFNNNQISLYFLMLSHYLADAHVPPHSDDRDFYKPPTIHPDMETYWDKEIKKFYAFDKKRKVFDYDLNGAPELKEKNISIFKNSLLYKVLDELNKRSWCPSDSKILGKKNKKVYDYVKSVCFVSYLNSTEFIPEMSKSDYAKIKILKDEVYKKKLDKLSVHILADAIDSVALVWLFTWDRYNKLKEEIRKKKKLIKKENKK